MTDLQKTIDEVEAKAAESELVGRLSADPEARNYNRRLAEELREYAARLKAGLIRGPISPIENC